MAYQVPFIGLLIGQLEIDSKSRRLYNDLWKLLSVKILMDMQLEKAQEECLEKMHQLCIQYVIKDLEQAPIPSVIIDPYQAALAFLRKKNNYPYLRNVAKEVVDIRRSICFPRHTETPQQLLTTYQALSEIPLTIFFSFLRLNPAASTPELYKYYLQAAYQVEAYFMAIYLVLEGSLTEVGAASVARLIRGLRLAAELQAAYALLLAAWQPLDTIPTLTLQRIESVAAQSLDAAKARNGI